VSAARLVHDVGKYIARTARNLPPGDVPEDLIAMLVQDLYLLAGGQRASVVFDDLAAGVPGAAGVRDLLSEIDRLEVEVRGGEQGAVRRAAALALEVERRLRALQGGSR
jgi:hypothetical protein